VAYVNHLKAVIAILGCFRWQNGWLPAGGCRDLCWKWKCQHWSRCTEDQCVGVFVGRNVAVMRNYFWIPILVENVTSVQFHHSHLPSKVKKKNSSLHHLWSTVYKLCAKRIFLLRPLVLQSTVLCITCIRCSEGNSTKITLISQWVTTLFTPGHQQKLTLGRCSSIWKISHHVYCILSHK